MPTEAERFAALRTAVDVLESAADELVTAIGRPNWVAIEESGKFRYDHPSGQLLQILKGVRTVSALNACLALLPLGHYAEVLMILRSANDFLSEIAFVHEAIETQNPTADQNRFLEHYFSDQPDTVNELLENPPRGSVVERRKLQASQARYLTPENPSAMQKRLAMIDAVFSGYVHGSYSSTMELYEGGTWRFRMRGMAGTPRAVEAEHQITLTTHRAFNMLRSAAWAIHHEAVFNALRPARIAFEQSAACEGMSLS